MILIPTGGLNRFRAAHDTPPRQGQALKRRRRSGPIVLEWLEVRALLTTQGPVGLATDLVGIAPAGRDQTTINNVLLAPAVDFARTAPVATNVARVSPAGSPVLQINPHEDRRPFAIPTVQASLSYGTPAGSLSYPACFDLRTSGYVTPVKDQGHCASCWAFATYGSLESAILKAGGPEMDFSENHLKNYHGFDWGPFDGGSVFLSQAYLSRWDGPVSEADDPYHDWDDRPSPGGPPQNYVRELSIFDTDADIKAALMNYGALDTSMIWDNAWYRPSDQTYYNPLGGQTNHEVTIVGWDDGKGTAAATPGAWLIKNSWGTAFGDQGYFWISYADTVDASFGVSFHDAVAPSTFSKVYYHDRFGDVATVDSPFAFNAFTAAANEPLKAVQFWTQADWANYDIRVYDTFSGGSLSHLLASTTGTIAYAGNHTVDLPTSVSLTAGDSFYVYVGITNGGQYPHSMDYRKPGYDSASTASPGESYYSFNGTTWTDLTTYDPTANFCIKALTGSGTPLPTLAITNVAVTEGHSGSKNATFLVILSAPCDQTVTVAWATGNGTAKAGSDYVRKSGTLTFLKGQQIVPLIVVVNGDRTIEHEETFVVNLSNPTNATIARGRGVGTILNDETQATIADVRIVEGNSGTRDVAFTVRLTGAGSFPVTVNYATADSTAKADSDYLARIGKLTFSRGQTSKRILIPIMGDRRAERNETFLIKLSSPSNAILARTSANGTIVNDDWGAPVSFAARSGSTASTSAGTLRAFAAVPSETSRGVPVPNSSLAEGQAAIGLQPHWVSFSRRRGPVWRR